MTDAQSDRRLMPETGLDFSMLTTDSVWGRDEIPGVLRKIFQDFEVVVDGEGRPVLNEKGQVQLQARDAPEWGALGFFTRDFRLANLTGKDVERCIYWSNLASDFIQLGFRRAFAVAVSRIAAILELSQSRYGFFRKQVHTLTQEHHYNEEAKEKKELLGLGRSKKQR